MDENLATVAFQLFANMKKGGIYLGTLGSTPGLKEEGTDSSADTHNHICPVPVLFHSYPFLGSLLSHSQSITGSRPPLLIPLSSHKSRCLCLFPRPNFPFQFPISVSPTIYFPVPVSIFSQRLLVPNHFFHPCRFNLDLHHHLNQAGFFTLPGASNGDPAFLHVVQYTFGYITAHRDLNLQLQGNSCMGPGMLRADKIFGVLRDKNQSNLC